MSALLTDLYELTMAAGYFEAGKSTDKAVFELSIRRLPKHRNFVLAAGLHQVVEYLLNLRFQAAEIEYLRGLKQFRNVSRGFFEYLADFQFTGDLFAAPEGTPLFAGEPVLAVRAPIIEAQIPETYLLSAITFQTLVATKAARMVEAGRGRSVVEFGTRRAHTPYAGVLGARAAYIGGCAGTSNTLAGFRFGIPVMGTEAHAWVMSFESEAASFGEMQRLMGDQTVHLVDTYDTIEGVRRAIETGRPMWGIRLDSGNFLSLSRQAREMLDAAGLRDAKIMVSGDMDEYKIAALARENAPVDAFGVGTELATSGDAPSMGAIYKMVEIESGGVRRFTAKHAAGKSSLPGRKQVFRFKDRDVVGRAGECFSGSRALLEPVIYGGRTIQPLPSIEQIRSRAAKALSALPDEVRDPEREANYPVEYSQELKELSQTV